jgi:hypothetical protein
MVPTRHQEYVGSKTKLKYKNNKELQGNKDDRNNEI